MLYFKNKVSCFLCPFLRDTIGESHPSNSTRVNSPQSITLTPGEFDGWELSRGEGGRGGGIARIPCYINFYLFKLSLIKLQSISSDH